MCHLLARLNARASLLLSSAVDGFEAGVGGKCCCSQSSINLRRGSPAKTERSVA
jgi:hypothetical protein